MFELQIVSCLAWFSATTHIAALRLLREYLYDHPVTRNLRVLPIGAFLVLILSVQMLLTLGRYSKFHGYPNYALPIQCIIVKAFRHPGYKTSNEETGRSYMILFLAVLYIYHTYALFTDPRKLALPGRVSRLMVAAIRRDTFGKLLPERQRVVLDNAELQRSIILSPRASMKYNMLRMAQEITRSLF